MITCKLRMSTLSNDVVLYLYKTLMFYFELVQFAVFVAKMFFCYNITQAGRVEKKNIKSVIIFSECHTF